MSHFTNSISALVILVAVWSLILGNLGYSLFKLLRSERKLGD